MSQRNSPPNDLPTTSLNRGIGIAMILVTELRGM